MNNAGFLRPSSKMLSIISILSIVISLITLIPLIWAVSLALKSSSETVGGSFLPKDPQWGNFAIAWTQYGMKHFFLNSLVITVTSVLFTIFISFIAAYAFSKLAFKGSELIYRVLLVGVIIPPAALVIPLLLQLNSLGLYNTHLGLSVTYATLGLPLAIMIFRGFISSFSFEIIEAARIDGCSETQVLWRILFPLSKAPISTVAIVLFLANWNEFLLALVLLRDANMFTLPVGIASQIGQYTSEYNLISSASLIASIPVFVLYLFLQNNFQRGLSDGALKQ